MFSMRIRRKLCVQEILKTKTRKGYLLFSVLIIATIAVVSFSLALATCFSQSINPNPANAQSLVIPINAASPASQFNVTVSYAYVGPAPTNTTYFDPQFNTTMYLASQYPSIVLLNITRLSGVQIPSCDAIVQVYGIKVATNTGKTESYAYFVGTNYNSSFSMSNQSALCPYVNYLVDHNIYNYMVGRFDFNWTADTSILSQSFGSIETYTDNPNTVPGLYGAGIPNTINVSIYRIGYVTMSDGVVSCYEDTATSSTIVSVKLSTYGDGFLYNKLVPSTELSQTNLFGPNTGSWFKTACPITPLFF